jgi:hypothetical protein
MANDDKRQLKIMLMNQSKDASETKIPENLGPKIQYRH